ncbi:ferredoxin reductase [Mesorhizobium sp. L-8-10]|uniref:NAD(P)/FAD-dependent oxidoreductase n=1 Tax=Mesorhizobium sp. L-8-10 TaxID=2744523 RepID=UPI001927DF3C|nr:FAD-dependent oxidoreductase [Mesorhizobium sp. L-8-10]BCH33640.1 ferredoxin reductase [Mesorhizobium sp. L-8-10]
MVIVGAGEAGCAAALGLRANGYGGPVALIGEEAQAPYERPPLSKPPTNGGAIEPKPIVTPSGLASAGITFLESTRVASIDRSAQTVAVGDGGIFAYDKLLLATGASPRRLNGLPTHERIMTVRTLDDARRFCRAVRPGVRLAMVGAGFIGLELAAFARQRGAEVVVLEAQERVLKRGVPAPIAAIIAARHSAEGVRIMANARIVEASLGPSQVAIRLGTGETLLADHVVVGVGASPNDGLARASGLACDDGIVVDGSLATLDPHIFAAGDCCRFPVALYCGRHARLESWRSAREQGEHAASAMLGDPAPFDAVPWFWSDQYELGLQVVGLAELSAGSVERKLRDDGLIVFDQAADGRLLAASAIGPGTSAAREIKVAEQLIRSRRGIDPALLADGGVSLKSLLRPEAIAGAAS